MLLLNVYERNALVHASRESTDAIKLAIESIRRSNPEAFHNSRSLRMRIFFDRPLRDEPHKGFIREGKEQS